jgi:hypothetical protein
MFLSSMTRKAQRPSRVLASKALLVIRNVPKPVDPYKEP